MHVPRDDKSQGLWEVGTKLPTAGAEAKSEGGPSWRVSGLAFCHCSCPDIGPPVRLVYLPSRSAQMPPPPGRLLRLPCWQHLPDFGVSTALSTVNASVLVLPTLTSLQCLCGTLISVSTCSLWDGS